MRVSAFVLAFVVSVAAVPAWAQGTERGFLARVTLEDVRSVLQDDGYRAEIRQDDSGGYVASASSGHNFFASLDECEGDAPCRVLVLETGGWTPMSPLSVEVLDAFHTDNDGWVAATHPSDGKYYGTYRAPLVGGVSREWLRYCLRAFVTSADSFAELMQQ